MNIVASGGGGDRVNCNIVFLWQLLLVGERCSRVYQRQFKKSTTSTGRGVTEFVSDNHC